MPDFIRISPKLVGLTRFDRFLAHPENPNLEICSFHGFASWIPVRSGLNNSDWRRLWKLVFHLGVHLYLSLCMCVDFSCDIHFYKDYIFVST